MITPRCAHMIWRETRTFLERCWDGSWRAASEEKARRPRIAIGRRALVPQWRQDYPNPTGQRPRRPRWATSGHMHPSKRHRGQPWTVRVFKVLLGSSPITSTSPTSKAYWKSGPFAPPELPGFYSTVTLSDTRQDGRTPDNVATSGCSEPGLQCRADKAAPKTIPSARIDSPATGHCRKNASI